MKKLLLIPLIAAVAIVTVRLLGPRLLEHLDIESRMTRMFNDMPDYCPPKRMMNNIEAVREQGELLGEQNSRILEKLKEFRVQPSEEQ